MNKKATLIYNIIINIKTNNICLRLIKIVKKTQNDP